MGSAKDKHGVCERFAKETVLFQKNGRSRKKEFLYIYIYKSLYSIVFLHIFPLHSFTIKFEIWFPFSP